MNTSRRSFFKAAAAVAGIDDGRAAVVDRARQAIFRRTIDEIRVLHVGHSIWLDRRGNAACANWFPPLSRDEAGAFPARALLSREKSV